MFKFHSFIPLLNFFLAPFFGLFAAGDSALDVLGGGGAEGAVVDAAVEGGEGGEPTEGGEGGEGAAVAAGEGGEPDADAAKPAVQTSGKPGPGLVRPLSADANAAMKSLKDTNPKAWKELNSRIYALNGLDKKIAEAFPEGGLDAAIQGKQRLDQFLTDANAQDLDEVGKEIHGYRSVDQQILAGDIGFLKEMTPEMLTGLYNMMPQFVDQWANGAETRPFYEHYFAGLVTATLRDTGFTKMLEQAEFFLDNMGLDDKDVARVHGQVKGALDWIKNLDEKGKKVPDRKAAAAEPADKGLSEREQRVQAAEHKQMNLRIGAAVNAQKGGKFIAALKAECGGKIPGNVNVGEVIIKARENVAQALGKGFSDKLDEYRAAGDEQGAIKYTVSQLTEQRITDAVTKAYRYLYRGPALGAGARPAAPGARPAAGAAPPVQKGFTTINYNPKVSSIDLAASAALAKTLGISRDQLFVSNRAVLKGGKRVTWAQDADNEA